MSQLTIFFSLVWFDFFFHSNADLLQSKTIGLLFVRFYFLNYNVIWHTQFWLVKKIGTDLDKNITGKSCKQKLEYFLHNWVKSFRKERSYFNATTFSWEIYIKFFMNISWKRGYMKNIRILLQKRLHPIVFLIKAHRDHDGCW